MPDTKLSTLQSRLGRIVNIDESIRRSHSRDTWVLSDLHDYLGSPAQIPMAVIIPETTQAMSDTVALCGELGVRMIPYGAGSGVCGGILGQSDAVILSTAALAGLKALDSQNLLATFGAGTIGIEAEHAVASEGFTIGHWPQSIEISSVGGWVATRASGQYSTAYGNIEDILFSIEAVLPDGSVYDSRQTPRAAAGPDLKQVLLGSEGTLGIITEVTFSLRLEAVQQVQQAFHFATIERGLNVVREIMSAGWRPPVVRLYDPRESRRHFGESCPKGRAMLIFLHEEPCAIQESEAVAKICGAEQGVPAPQDIVQQWFQRRNDVPSFRSLIEQGLIVDTIEVGATWSRLPGVYHESIRALEAIDDVIAASAHMSHAYRSGANLYFTLAGSPKRVQDMEALYWRCWDAVMKVTMEQGGSIAHHHGIGRVRKSYLNRELGEAGMTMLRHIKQSLDPQGLFNPGNLLPDQ